MPANPAPSEHKPVECLRTFWELTGPSGILITCALYKTPTGLEVRAGHGEQDCMLRHVVYSMAAAEAYADIWKAAADTQGFAVLGL